MITISRLQPKQYKVTPEGVKLLQESLEDLRRHRQRITTELREMSLQNNTLGDSTLALHQSQVKEINDQIELLERIIGLVDTIKKPHSKEVVQLGSRVSVLLDGIMQSYVIVGTIEADPAVGKISEESPIGKTMIGKRVNEQFFISSPSKKLRTAIIVAID